MLRALLFRMVTDAILVIAQGERYAVVLAWILGQTHGRTGGRDALRSSRGEAMERSSD